MQQLDAGLTPFEEGELKGMREMLLFFGQRHLGPADATIRACLDGVRDRSRLMEMAGQVGTIGSWRDFFRPPLVICGSAALGRIVMEDSDTYKAILEEGEAIAHCESILDIGEERFGPADDRVKAALDDIADLDHLLRLVRQLVHASCWHELLATQ